LKGLGYEGLAALDDASFLLSGELGASFLGKALGRSGSVASRGGAAAVRLGQAGEAAVRATYDIGPAAKTLINVAGRTRIPDGLKPGVLSEVKNVAYQGLTSQLRDFMNYAATNRLRMDLYVRPTTVLSGPLQDAIRSGLINLRFIP
jgi:hypothetical protein